MAEGGNEVRRGSEEIDWHFTLLQLLSHNFGRLCGFSEVHQGVPLLRSAKREYLLALNVLRLVEEQLRTFSCDCGRSVVFGFIAGIALFFLSGEILERRCTVALGGHPSG